MSDDWGWFWASESRKDQILRDEVDSLNSAISAANSRSYRLTSQLQSLSGSLETRLQALSAAFDAYVELGDVREQLAAFPHTAAIRRDVVAAIETLAAGRTAEPVDPRGADYWLAYATNAVIALDAGHRDPEAEQTAASLAPEAERFVVTACGALGHGAAVADRLPSLLVSDGTLSSAQVVLWRAAVAGLYGDEVLAAIGEQWRPLLSDDAAGWLAWVDDGARTAGRTSLDWVADQTISGWVQTSTPAAAPPDAAAGLRAVVTEEVNRGLGAEGELLRRSRELRARIEHPSRASESGPGRESSEPDGADPTVLDEVCRTYVSLPPEHPVHQALTAWLAPGLLAAIPELERRATVPVAAVVSVRTSDGMLDVTPEGADEARRTQIRDRILLGHTVPSTRVLVPAAVAGLLLVVGIVAAIASSVGLLVLFAVAALAVGAYALVQERRRRTEAAEAERRLVEMDRAIQTGQQQAAAVAATQAQAVTDARAVAADVTSRLGALTSPAPTG